MPRGFSECQLQAIKGELVKAAFEALKNTGVRKTTVEGLAKTSRISTGAFYKFYPSKEALFFEVYDIAEERLKTEFTSILQTSPEISPATLQIALKQLLRSDTMNILLRLMKKEELDYILRNTNPALVEAHLQSDREYIQKLMEQFRKNGWKVNIDVNLSLSYLQALFTLCYEKDQYPLHAEQILDSFIDTIVNNSIS